MTQFTVNAERRDPYKNFKFRVLFDGRPVLGASKVSALLRTTEVIKFRQGGDPSNPFIMPGKTEHTAITIEDALTYDFAFEEWANKLWNREALPGGGRDMSLRDFRKNISIELLNEAGQLAMKFDVYRCWVSEYQALGELDANGNAVAIRHVKIENEGWERDIDVPEPAEPQF